MDKLNNMEFASGKDFVQKQKELEELLGVNEISPFGTYELEVFENNLKGATQLDLRKLAEKVGLNPFLDRGRLKSALVNEFKSYTKNARRNLIPQPHPRQIILDPNNPEHVEAIKILGEV